MDKNKTTVEELVEEWLSYDKKRNLRETTYSWLGITKKVKPSTPKNKEDKVCPRSEDTVNAEVSRLKINNNQGKVPEMESTFANTTNHKGLVKAAILDLNVGYFNQDQSMYYDTILKNLEGK